jgi:RNA-directed DNA polymerase
MRRVGSLFGEVITEEALYAAYLDARKGKRGTVACLTFERELGAQIRSLSESLADGSYEPRPYYQFWVTEPKPRLISAPAFRDRVVQHAIYRVVRPVFDRTFIDHSFACRPGKGTHQAADYVQQALREVPRESYTLQLDLRKFYYRIDREILQGAIERRIKDGRLVALMMRFARMPEPLGVPIGNLLSQLYALIYMNPLDHFVKRELKARRYARYVDDFVLLGLTLDEARSHRAAIEAFLRERLHMDLSKAAIAKASRGLNFCGYRTWAGKRFVRRRALYNFRRATRLGDTVALASMLGHARRTHSLRHLLRHLRASGLGWRPPPTYRRYNLAIAA